MGATSHDPNMKQYRLNKFTIKCQLYMVNVQNTILSQKWKD